MPERCPAFSELAAFNAGLVSARKFEDLARHLEDCSSCCHTMRELATQGELLGAPNDGMRDFQREPAYLAALEQVRHFSPWLSTQDATTPRIEQIGDCRLDRELARDRLGTTYEASSGTLGRPIAVRWLVSTESIDPQVLQRFGRELREVARFHHSHIVPVFQVGQERGRWYYVLQRIEGPSVHDLLKGLMAEPAAARGADQKGQSIEYVRRVARIGLQAAQALDYAHERNLLHRCLHPGNLRIDSSGSVWVSDFGLGRLAEALPTDNVGGEADYRQYQAPERRAGRGDARSDVFSLGTILRELLARPSSPAASNPNRGVPAVGGAVPAEIELILQQATAENPEQRYATARRMAEDLQRFLKDPSSQAGLGSAPRRVWSWGWHRPLRSTALAGLSLAGLVIVSAIAILVALNAERFVRGPGESVSPRPTTADSALLETQQERLAWETKLVDTLTGLGQQAVEQGELQDALLWFAMAARQGASFPDRSARNAQRAEILMHHLAFPVANWEGGPLARRPLALWLLPGLPFLLVQTSAQGITSGESPFRLLNVDSGQLATQGEAPWFEKELRDATAAAWNPDGSLLAIAQANRGVRIYSFPAGKELERVEASANITRVSFAPDSRRLAVIERRRLRFWDRPAQRFVADWLELPALIDTVEWERNGGRLATSCRDGFARMIETTPVPRLLASLGPIPHSPWLETRLGAQVLAPRFVSEDRVLTITSRELQWWDLKRGEKVQSLAIEFSAIHSSELSADGRWLALAGEIHGKGGVRVVEANTGDPASPLVKQLSSVWSVAFHPDGKTLATSGADGTVRFWTLPELDISLPPLQHATGIVGTRISPDGRSVVTGQVNGEIRVWRLPEEWPIRLPIAGQGGTAVLSEDGRVAAVGGHAGAIDLLRLDAYRQPASGTVNELVSRAELVTGRRFTTDQGLIPLTSSEWLERWRRVGGGIRIQGGKKESPASVEAGLR